MLPAPWTWSVRLSNASISGVYISNGEDMLFLTTVLDENEMQKRYFRMLRVGSDLSMDLKAMYVFDCGKTEVGLVTRVEVVQM